MSQSEASFDEVQLKGGCALGCVAAAMFFALSALALVAMLALALGVSQTLGAIVPPEDLPTITNH